MYGLEKEFWYAIVLVTRAFSAFVSSYFHKTVILFYLILVLYFMSTENEY